MSRCVGGRTGPSVGGGFALVAGLTLGGCLPGPVTGADTEGSGDGPGPRIVVTTTDFATGAISVVDPDRRTVARDVALASTDAIPFVHDGRVVVLNRFMHDYVDVYDPAQDWALLAEHPIDDVGGMGTASTNPHGVAFDAKGRAYLALYGAGTVQVHDFSAPSGESFLAELSLADFADDDGIAESGVVFSHGEAVWVALARVARREGWRPVGPAELVKFDTAGRVPTLIDLDPERDGVQGLELPGIGVRQVRRDPKDPDRVYLLCNGVVAVDLVAQRASWVVSDAQMAEAGLDNQLLPQSFDVDDDGDTLYIAAYRGDFSGVDIHTVSASGGVPEPLVTGLNAVERTLEVIGDEIWFGDTSVGGAGMRVFDLQGRPLGEPLSTGLDPYAVVEL